MDRRRAPFALLTLLTLLVLTLLPAPAMAQEPGAGKPARARPVPGLGAPQPAPCRLPRGKHASSGPGYLVTRPAPTTLVVHWSAAGLEQRALGDPRIGDVPRRDASWFTGLVGGDFDGDGAMEGLAHVGGLLWVLRAEGAAEQARGRRGPLPELGLGPWFAGVALDWDGDRAADVLSLHGAKVVVQRGLFGERRSGVLLDLGALAGDGELLAGTAGDWDLDGANDLVLALPGRGLVWVRNEGAPGAPRFGAPIPLWPEAPGVLVTSLVLAAVDDDPWPDLLVGTAAPGADREFGFAHRVPRRDRSAADDEALRTAEAELLALDQQHAREELGLRSPDHRPAPSRFERVRAQHRLRLQIDALRWCEVPMVAREPFLQTRAAPR